MVFAGNLLVRSSLWTPANISTALWLDAADASTVTESGGLVSQWDDKSGEGRNVFQGTSSSQPTYTSGSHLTFDGTNDVLIAGSNYLYSDNTNSGLSIISVVSSNVSDTSPDFVFDFGLYGNDGYGFVFNRIRTVAYCAVGWGGANVNETRGVALSTSPQIAGMRIEFGNTIEALLNGSAILSSAITLTELTDTEIQQASTRTANDGPVCIGGQSKTDPDVDRFLDGNLYELVVVRTSGTTVIQKLEGYLAHKWGLTANLPGGHLYKSVAP